MALTARKLVRAAPLVTGKLHELEELRDPLGDLSCRALANRKRETDILCDRHVREQSVILKDEADIALPEGATGDVLAVEREPSTLGCFETGDHAQERRFTAARRPEQNGERTAFDAQVDVAKRTERTERLRQVFDDNAHRCRCGERFTTSLR